MGKRSRSPRTKKLRLYEPPSIRIKHEMQLGPPEKDCAIGCLAMIGGTDYTTAWLYATSVAPNVERSGMSATKVIEALAEMTGEHFRLRRLPYPRPALADPIEWPPVPCIAIIRAVGESEGHMIVWEPSGWIHDPQWHKRIRLKTYAADFTEVRLIAFILPIESESTADGA